MPVLLAVIAYWVFSLLCGFAFGTVRELLITPRFGPIVATALELPFILIALWFGCGIIVRRLRLSRGQAAAMGVLWFLAFIPTEILLGMGLRGWDWQTALRSFTTPNGSLGLAAFILAALFPLLVPRR
jgi:hypothetical protein